MTVLEIMVVLAIIGGMVFIGSSAWGKFSRTDLIEGSKDVASLSRAASARAIQWGELHRLTIDLDKQIVAVEMCQGSMAIARNEALMSDPEETKRAMERAQQRMGTMPAQAFATGDSEEGARRASAIAGHHIQDKQCTVVDSGFTGDSQGKKWTRTLLADKGIKFKEVWVQHLDDSVTKGQVGIYFFPSGTAEKAVIEITDGTDTFTVTISGVSGRVELLDAPLANVDDFLLRNPMGEKDAARESDQ